MPAYSVVTRILGEDFASEAFRKVGETAKSAFKPITAFNAALDKPQTTALGKVGNAVDGVAGKFRTGLSSISAWLPALGALGSVATLGGLIEMTRHASEAYEGLALGAQKLGVSTKDLAVWRYGAKLAGVESEQLEKGLIKANKAMVDAATGKNKDVAALFAAMKIPLRDAQGHIKGVGNSLEDIAEAFKNTENPAVRDAAAIALFGRAGADLLPFLIKGRAGIVDLRAEMTKYSGLTNENRENLEHLAISYKQLDKAGSGLSSKLSAVFAPILAKIVDGTTDWIVANRDLIAQSLERKIGAMAGAYTALADGMRKVLDTPIVKSLFDGADAGTAFDGALGLLGITLAGPLFAGVQMVTKAVWAMNAAMLKNPFIAVAALVVGAAYEIVTHWDEVTAAFESAWKAAGVLGVAFELVNVPVNALYMAINSLSKALFGIDLDKWGDSFERAISVRIDSTIKGLREMLDLLKRIWAPIQGAFEWFGGGSGGGGLVAPGNNGASSSPDLVPFGALPPAPSPDSPAAMAQSAPPPAEVKVSVDFANVPKGAEVKATTTGVSSSNVSVGRSMDVY